MKKLLLLILPVLLVACGDDKDEPRPAKLDGCYYLSHTKIETRTPVGDGFYNTSVKEEDHRFFLLGEASTTGDMIDKIPCSIFFENKVVYYFWATLPSQPSQADYNVNTTEGQIEYEIAYQNWCEQCEWKDGGYYTSTFKVSNGSLYIGKADMGQIAIESNNFTLDYTYTNPKGEIVKKTFTYTYYPSFSKEDI